MQTDGLGYLKIFKDSIWNWTQATVPPVIVFDFLDFVHNPVFWREHGV